MEYTTKGGIFSCVTFGSLNNMFSRKKNSFLIYIDDEREDRR